MKAQGAAHLVLISFVVGSGLLEQFLGSSIWIHKGVVGTEA